MFNYSSIYRSIICIIILISQVTSNLLLACDTSPSLIVSNVLDNGDGTYYMDISACIGTEGSADGFDLYFNNDINITATTVTEVTASGTFNIAQVSVNNGIWLASFDGYDPVTNGPYFENGAFGLPCIEFGIIVDDNPEGATLCSVGMNEDCLGFTQPEVFITCGVIPGPCLPNYSITDNGIIDSDVSIAGENCNFAPFNDEIIELTVTCAGTFNFSLAQDAGFWASESWLTLALECCSGVLEQSTSFFESPITLETYLDEGTYFLIVDVYSDNFTPGTYTLDISSDADLSLVTQALAGEDQLICDESTILNGNNPIDNNEIGTWTLMSGTGNFTDLNDPLTLVTNLSDGNNIFQWNIANECSNSTDQVTIEVANNIIFDIPETLYCLDQIPLVVLGDGNNGEWSITPNLNVEIDNINNNNTFANVSAYGDYTITYTICDETFTTNISMESISPELSSPNNDYYCLENFQLNATITNDPGYWEVEGPFLVDFNNITSTNPIVTVFGYGTYTFTYYGCGSSSEIVINMLEEQPILSGPTEIYCTETFNLEAQLYGDPGYWDFEGPGNVIFSNQNELNTNVSVDSYGAYIFTYYGCGTMNFIQVNSLEAEPQILTPNNQTIYCNLETNLEASVLGDPGYWDFEGPGNVIFSNQNGLNTAVSVDAYGVYEFTYYGCGTESNVCTIIFETIEPEIIIENNINCQLTTMLNGDIQNNASIEWFINNTPNNASASIENPSNLNTEITVSQYGVYEIGLNSCGNTALMEIEFQPVPPHIISPNFQNCILSATLIAYTDDINNAGPWTQISGPTGVIFSNPMESVTEINVPQFGLYTFQYESCDTFSTTTIGFECPLEFPNTMTPNGDGNNDYFIIDNLNPEIYSNSILTVYNRWGSVVYISTEYGLSNEWWNGTTTYENKILNDGIYYYILEVYNNIKRQKEEYSGELHLFFSSSSSSNEKDELEQN